MCCSRRIRYTRPTRRALQHLPTWVQRPLLMLLLAVLRVPRSHPLRTRPTACACLHAVRAHSTACVHASSGAAHPAAAGAPRAAQPPPHHGIRWPLGWSPLQGGILALDLSPASEAVVATAGGDADIKLYDRAAEQILATLSGHAKKVHGAP